VEQIDLRTQALLQWGLPLAVEAVAVLGWGRTVGEAAVQIRTRARRSAWTIPGRFVKLATGVGGLAVLGALDVPGAGGALLVLVLAHLVGAVATRDGRGLSNALAGLDVELAVPPRPTPDRATTPD
jgi:hypothetical protein